MLHQSERGLGRMDLEVTTRRQCAERWGDRDLGMR